MYSILFVCTGNICRSPTAEAVMRTFSVQKGWGEDVLHIDSAGTYGYHVGAPPDSRSVATATARGVEMAGLSARKVEMDDFERFDLIIAMDKGHYHELQSICPKNSDSKIILMTEFHPKSKNRDVPDPYYGAEDGFDTAYNLIEESCEGLLKYLEKHINFLP